MIEPPSIIKFLSRHSETLEALRLGVRDIMVLEGKFLSQPLSSLQIFPNLSEISLNSIFIFNDINESPEDDTILVRLLPSSVITLWLSDSVGPPVVVRLTRALDRLARATSEGHFPCLRRILCQFGEETEDTDDGSLAQRFAKLGVYLGYSAWPYAR